MAKKSFFAKSFSVVFSIILSLIIVFGVYVGGYILINGGTKGVSVHIDGNCQNVGYTEYHLPFNIVYKIYDKSVGEHQYEQTEVIKAPSCVEEGDILYTCPDCGKTKHVIEKLPHNYGETYQTTNVEHWRVCVDCGNLEIKKAHEFIDVTLIKPTCLQDGEIKHTCEKCAYEYIENVLASEVSKGSNLHDYSIILEEKEPTCIEKGEKSLKCSNCGDIYNQEIAKLTHHEYEGTLCKWCDRDELLEYIDEFETKGTKTNPIILNSEEEAICYVNYVIANEITYDKYAVVECLGSKESEEIMAWLLEIKNKSTAANFAISMGTIGLGGNVLCYVKCNESSLTNSATIKNDGTTYIQSTKPQALSTVFYNNSKTRTNSTVLPYESRTQIMSVKSSNQLYYALSHGYKPVPVEHSVAKTVLEKAEEVCREIINDNMSDVDKLYAIYSWIAQNIAYDTGAVNYTESQGGKWTECTAWYLEGVFFEKTAVCDAIAKSVSVLANIENIKCLVVSGMQHAWNKVCVDTNNDGEREWYVLDATHANILTQSCEVYDISQFLITDDKKEDFFKIKVGDKEDYCGYRAENLKDCKAETEFNVYKYLHYNTVNPNENNDFYIESYNEFQNLLTHYKTEIENATKHNETISLQVVFSKNYTGFSYTNAYGLISANVSTMPIKIYNGDVYVEFIFSK